MEKDQFSKDGGTVFGLLFPFVVIAGGIFLLLLAFA